MTRWDDRGDRAMLGGPPAKPGRWMDKPRQQFREIAARERQLAARELGRWIRGETRWPDAARNAVRRAITHATIAEGLRRPRVLGRS